jgi:hypothetical protein
MTYVGAILGPFNDVLILFTYVILVAAILRDFLKIVFEGPRIWAAVSHALPPPHVGFPKRTELRKKEL